MKMFLTPAKTVSISLVWSDEHSTFLPVPPREGEPVFELATPTEQQAHEQYLALLGVQGRDGFASTHRLMWGRKADKDNKASEGLVRRVHGIDGDINPVPALTLALARIAREEAGMVVPLQDPTATRLDAEGNSDSPSGSGSDSTPSPAGCAETQSPDQA